MTKLVKDILFWILLLASLGAMVWHVEAQDTHRHSIKDLRLAVVKIEQTKDGKLYYIDIEDLDPRSINLKSVEVAKEFRYIRFEEEKNGQIVGEIKGLGGMVGMSGILTICSKSCDGEGCGKALSFRAGSVNLFK